MRAPTCTANRFSTVQIWQTGFLANAQILLYIYCTVIWTVFAAVGCYIPHSSKHAYTCKWLGRVFCNRSFISSSVTNSKSYNYVDKKLDYFHLLIWLLPSQSKAVLAYSLLIPVLAPTCIHLHLSALVVMVWRQGAVRQKKSIQLETECDIKKITKKEFENERCIR